MPYTAWQAFIEGADGLPVSGASVEVRLESSGALATIYSDKDGAALANPFTTGSDGLARFYAAGGFYKITATSGAFSAAFRFVPVGQAAGYDVGTASGEIPTIALADIRYNPNLNHNLTATSAPTVDDDSTAGYEIQSVWVDTSVSPDQRYICLDNTEGAAVWVEVYSSVGGTSANLITADSTGMPEHPDGNTYNWTFSDVQEFIDELVNGVGPGLTSGAMIKRGFYFGTEGGEYGYMTPGAFRIGNNDGGIVVQNSFDAMIATCTPETGSATGGWSFSLQNNTMQWIMNGATSGSNPVQELKRESGYIATINTTGSQQKVAEWDTVAFKATRAFQLPVYANLAAINAAITSPQAGMLVYVTGQGMAIYKASWVRTTDETTAIT